MKLAPITRTPDPNILPDIDDPNFYCKSCQAQYASCKNYRIHLRRVHGLKLVPLRKKSTFDSTISVDDTKNPKDTTCIICKLRYSSRTGYQTHMKNTHKDGRSIPVNRAIIIPNSRIQPDPDDSNFFCRTRQRHYSNEYKYRRHIRLMHPDTKMEEITREAIMTPIMAEIDAGNSNNKTCTIYDYEFSFRDNYRRHTNTVHKYGNREPVALGRLSTAKIDTGIIPIWNDPNNYCRSCKRAYSGKWT